MEKLCKWGKVVCMVCGCKETFYYLQILPEDWRISQMKDGLLCGPCSEKFYGVYCDKVGYIDLERTEW